MPNRKMDLSSLRGWDTETTGVDCYHKSRPFLVTTCDMNGENIFWEWEVNPLTRIPKITQTDLDEIEHLLKESIRVLQNTKFDVGMLAAVRPRLGSEWQWDRTYDTLLAGHLLASNHPHDLTSMVLANLGEDMHPYEDALNLATKEARSLAKTHLPEWKIAKDGLPGMPSVRGELAKYDMWLPRAICIYAQGEKVKWIKETPKEQKLLPDRPWWWDYADREHPWLTVCSDYANVDSAMTLQLFLHQKKQIEERGLWAIYLERLKALPVAYKMEKVGITVNKHSLQVSRKKFSTISRRQGKICADIAAEFNYDLELPKSGNNSSMSRFMFGFSKLTCTTCGKITYLERSEDPPEFSSDSCEKCAKKKDQVAKVVYQEFPMLDLPRVKISKKTGKPAMDKGVMEYYLTHLEENSNQFKFIEALASKRAGDTAVQYLDGYERFWIPLDKQISHEDKLWYVLHPSLNMTGTATLRWSSSHPNEQNISKRENFNLRQVFGPAPGREWWSMDAQNIELRIPAFTAGEPELMDVFLHPEKPPYFGSYHLVVFHALHPKLFEEHGKKCKTLFESTFYQWVKNGNFAIIYGAQEETADRTYKVPGAYRLIQKRFPRIAGLNEKLKRQANEYGYVEALPDRSVCPERGYPILCTRSQWGDILPTVPLNYMVQSTAMQWMTKAMVRCQSYLDEINAKIEREDRKYHIIGQIHDEMLYDFPTSTKPSKVPHLFNLPIIKEVQRLMMKGGDDIGIPTPVGTKYHPRSWAEGLDVA